MSTITEIVRKIEEGDRSAAEQLLPLVYDELRRLAAAKLHHEKPGQTLQATALVHEAYLALVDQQQTLSWDSRAHFFAAAAEAMRRILINSAVRKRRPKHGGDLRRVDLDEHPVVADSSTTDLEALNEALTRLEQTDAQAAEVVKLKYFAGLTLPQIAELLQLAPRTVDRRWAYARAWLRLEMEKP